MESRGEKCSWDGVRFWPIEASNTLENYLKNKGFLIFL